jgi:hypothetical protein
VGFDVSLFEKCGSGRVGTAGTMGAARIFQKSSIERFDIDEASEW